MAEIQRFILILNLSFNSLLYICKKKFLFFEYIPSLIWWWITLKNKYILIKSYKPYNIFKDTII